LPIVQSSLLICRSAAIIRRLRGGVNSEPPAMVLRPLQAGHLSDGVRVHALEEQPLRLVLLGVSWLAHGVHGPVNRRILPLGRVDPRHVRQRDCLTVNPSVPGIALRLHPGRRDESARLNGVGTEHLDLSALQGLLRHGAREVRVVFVVLCPLRVLYGLPERLDLLRAPDPCVVVVIRRVCLLNDLHLPLFQRVGVCLRGEKGIRVREHRVLVPGVGHGLPPLLRRQLAPGRHIPGLDLARGVLVHPAVLSGGVLHAVAQVQQLPEPRVRIELFIDGVLLGLQPVIPPPRFRI